MSTWSQRMEDNILPLVLARAVGTRRGRRPGHAHTHHARESGEPGCIGHGAIRTSGAVQQRARREGSNRTPTMNAPRQSDRRIVPEKSPNKPAVVGAEGMEGRRRREGNASRQLACAGRRAGRTCVVAEWQTAPQVPRRPKRGAGCGKSARPDLRGGRPARAVPTATGSCQN